MEQQASNEINRTTSFDSLASAEACTKTSRNEIHLEQPLHDPIAHSSRLLSADDGVSGPEISVSRNPPHVGLESGLVYICDHDDDGETNRLGQLEVHTDSWAVSLPIKSSQVPSIPLNTAVSQSSSKSTIYMCHFESSGTEGPVMVYSAQPKRAERIREKLAEYRAEGAEWPLTACILDPVRASVVCEGPAQMLEAVKWFTCQPQGRRSHQLVPCRIKNKFARERADTVGLIKIHYVSWLHCNC